MLSTDHQINVRIKRIYAIITVSEKTPHLYFEIISINKKGRSYDKRSVIYGSQDFQ